jgi:hypothetical protein
MQTCAAFRTRTRFIHSPDHIHLGWASRVNLQRVRLALNVGQLCPRKSYWGPLERSVVWNKVRRNRMAALTGGQSGARKADRALLSRSNHQAHPKSSGSAFRHQKTVVENKKQLHLLVRKVRWRCARVEEVTGKIY